MHNRPLRADQEDDIKKAIEFCKANGAKDSECERMQDNLKSLVSSAFITTAHLNEAYGDQRSKIRQGSDFLRLFANNSFVAFVKEEGQQLGIEWKHFDKAMIGNIRKVASGEDYKASNSPSDMAAEFAKYRLKHQDIAEDPRPVALSK